MPLIGQTDFDNAEGQVETDLNTDSVLIPLPQVNEVPAVPLGPKIDVYAEVSSDNIEQNIPFPVTVMVKHPNPIEVRVQPPDFEGDFSIERIRTEIQLLKDKNGLSTRWTCVEFLLIPLTAGSKYLGAFEVSIPGKTAATRRIRLLVNDEKSLKEGRLQWIGRETWLSPPSVITVGKPVEAGLRLLDFNRNKTPIKELPLHIEAPENAVIEDMPVTAADKAAGIYFRVKILPLGEKDVRIAAHNFRFEGRTLSVPALHIRVIPELQDIKTQVEPQVDISLQPDNTASQDKLLSPSTDGESLSKETFEQLTFPSFNFKKFFFLKSNQIVALKAKSFFDNGQYAQSLATLRRGERNLLAGRQLKSLRETVEKKLGLTDMPDEGWMPHLFVIFFGTVSALLLLSICVIFIFRKRTSNKINRLRISQILAAAIFSLSVFFIILPKRSTNAVLKFAPVSSVPEALYDSQIYFLEGERVNVRLKTTDWVFVETYKGESGWVARDRVVFF